MNKKIYKKIQKKENIDYKKAIFNQKIHILYKKS